jgi:hypothetical protein
MPSTIKTVGVERVHAKTYFAKARQFCEAAATAYTEDNFDAAVVLAIHAGISGADAVSIGLGTRKCADSHDRAADLLEEIGSHAPAFAQQAKRLRTLIAMKNHVEYENRRATRDHAEQSVRRCENLVGWAQSELVKAKLLPTQ